MSREPLRIAVDIGGTFTDGVCLDAQSGRIWVGKCLTTPSDPSEGAASVVRQLLRQLALHSSRLSGTDVGEVVHATTLVTNTLIERNGAKTALIVTQGTSDLPDIAREVRYDLYDLDLELPEPLVPPDRRFEANERLNAQGDILKPLDGSDLARISGAIRDGGFEAAAVCLLHSYANDRHERAVEDAVREIAPDVSISISCRIAPEVGEFERMSTTAANAYVQPLMARYLNRLGSRLREAEVAGALRIMLSSGGFTAVESAAEAPIQLLESGPAAGVISAIVTGEAAGEKRILAFDMGGTTAKACVVRDGEPEVIRSFEAARVRRFKKGSGLPMLVPSIDLMEIGAGGGSIASVSGVGTLVVGPRSAGAVPGPACYAQGGTEATVTDADLVLGYLDADRFLGGEMRLDRRLAEDAIGRLGEKLNLPVAAAAWGICSVVNETMAAAARVHIAEKGHDPRQFALVATGGAGPVHAVDVARRLRLSTVLCTIAAGAGSCLGLLAAAARAERAWPRRTLLSEVAWSEAAQAIADLHADALQELSAAGTEESATAWDLSLDMRYRGQSHNVGVTLPLSPIDPSLEERIRTLFEVRYRHLYGALVPGAEPEIVTWRLIGRSPRDQRRFAWADGRAERRDAKPRTHRPIFIPRAGDFAEAPVYDRYAVPPGTRLFGPLVLEERESTLIVAEPAGVSVLPDLTVRIDLPTERSDAKQR
ncbi:MAG TPA: hydantoinase/oxoprolinase family protein [Stellaceae bacterium]|nr:hydantoinase/oxoprolinase family protein [Stellaceae bacterium]